MARSGNAGLRPRRARRSQTRIMVTGWWSQRAAGCSTAGRRPAWRRRRTAQSPGRSGCAAAGTRPARRSCAQLSSGDGPAVTPSRCEDSIPHRPWRHHTHAERRPRQVTGEGSHQGSISCAELRPRHRLPPVVPGRQLVHVEPDIDPPAAERDGELLCEVEVASRVADEHPSRRARDAEHHPAPAVAGQPRTDLLRRRSTRPLRTRTE
jgi:hypothetical protein